VELFLAELQPGLVLYIGDMCDFYLLSKFNKDPKRASLLQSDLNSTADLFKRHRQLMPNARMIMEDGNHCFRLRNYLWSKATELSSLDCLTVEGLLKLKENGIEHVDYEEGILINGIFWATHGDLIRKFSSYTAKGMSDKHGGSGIHGHSHRLGCHYKRNRSGIYGWWENGCLCNLDPDYMTYPDWQQGFSLVEFTHHRFWVQQMHIINRKFMYGNRIYGSGGKTRE
jgi:hypothetical protein